MNEELFQEKEHHKQQELCKIRPAYRQGRNLTAVKVYTVNNESQHLFIYGVPQINLRCELKSLCSKYGQILNLHAVADHKTEIFTECYHVQYQRIQSARIAKRLLDNKSFYGGILHVCYAPEYENVEETRTKLFQRSKDVLVRLNGNILQNESAAIVQDSRQTIKKRKYPTFNLNDDLSIDNIQKDVLLCDSRLTVKLSTRNNEIREQVSAVEYGPCLSDFLGSKTELSCPTKNKDDMRDNKNYELDTNKTFKNNVLNMIPTQVRRANENVNRIVFTRKK